MRGRLPTPTLFACLCGAASLLVAVWAAAAGLTHYATAIAGLVVLSATAGVVAVRGSDRAASLLLVAGCYGGILYSTTVLGVGSSVHLLTIPIALMCTALFRLRRTSALLATVVVPVGLLALVHVGGIGEQPSASLDPKMLSRLSTFVEFFAFTAALTVAALLVAADGDTVRAYAAANTATAIAAEQHSEELLQTRRRLRVTSEKLEVANAAMVRSARLTALGQLAGGLAHDFNNMLMAVQHFVTFARESMPAGSEALEDLDQAERATARATRLSRQLLQFSRQEPAVVRAIDCNDLVSELEEMLRRAVGSGIVIDVQLEPELPKIRANAAELEQVLVNLVINARDAIDGPGRIQIATRSRGGRVEIEVSDDGEGMPAEVRERAFEPFFTTKARDEGTGLGLSTCYAVVTGGGGDIDLQSEPGVGTTFRLSWPAVDAEASDWAAERRRNTVRRCSGGVVLLAEDDEVLRLTARRVLERAGFVVLAASSGIEALKVAESRPPDVLLTDIIMPGMSGTQLAASLRRSYPDLRVVFMTGCDVTELATGSGWSGEEPVMQKPVTPAQLVNGVCEVLEPGLSQAL